MTKAEEYGRITTTKISEMLSREKQALETAALKIFENLSQGGVLNIFGSGHSHMVVEEAFHRAGGLIPVNAWLEEYLMPHMGPARNGPLERLPGLAKIIFDFYEPLAGEVLVVISNSGINSVVVEMAKLGKKAGLFVVGLTCLEHSKKSLSRDLEGKKLFEVCDQVIDTGGVSGDGAVAIRGLDVSAGPLSTILSSVAINYLSVRVCELYSEKGLEAPVYKSANASGGDERNKKLESQYRGRIKRLY